MARQVANKRGVMHFLKLLFAFAVFRPQKTGIKRHVANFLIKRTRKVTSAQRVQSTGFKVRHVLVFCYYSVRERSNYRLQELSCDPDPPPPSVTSR